MSSSIKGTSIRLTRGDTFRVRVAMTNGDGSPYEMQEGDSVRFRCVKRKGDREAVIEKIVDPETMLLSLAHSDTASLNFGTYFYDMQLTKADGDVDTFIAEAQFVVAPEADPAE